MRLPEGAPSPYVVFFLFADGRNIFFSYGMSKEVAGTSELRMGGYDLFIFSLFYVLHVSAVHQFILYVQTCRFIRYLMSVPARYMLHVCVSCL